MEYDYVKQLDIPDEPGVYFFIGPRREILYIGKASSLRDRVRSYFANDLIATRGPRIVDMVTRAKTVKWHVADSVLEALIMEANLIKKHQPPYNIEGKDDKSFNYVVITNEEFPRVLTVRGRELEQKFPKAKRKYLFGPFPHGGQLKAALKIIRRIFPFFDTAKPVTEVGSRHDQGKVQFYQQIGHYPDISRAEARRDYARTINHLRLFFSGKKGELIKQLEREMKRSALKQEFEKAAESKRKLFALQHIQDVSLIKDESRAPRSGRLFRIEAYDIAHTGGRDMVGVMAVVENGEVHKRDYRTFIIRGYAASNDIGALTEVLTRRLRHDEWRLPNLIVVDGGRAHINAAEQTLSEFGYRIPVVSVVKDERHKPREILGDRQLIVRHQQHILVANAEAHRFALSFHRKKQRLRVRT